jgi:hypothetical protein
MQTQTTKVEVFGYAIDSDWAVIALVVLGILALMALVAVAFQKPRRRK